MKKLRIGMSALIYPVFMGRFVWEALERRPDVDVFMVGPYFGKDIPWAGGITIDEKYVKQPYVALPTTMARANIPYEMVAHQMPDDLDIFIMADAGWHFISRPKAKKVALLQTDPHVLKDHYRKVYSIVDKSFCMQSSYMDANDVFLPYAADTHRFYPEEQEIIHDACLIGLHYQTRDQLVKTLRNKGLDVYYDIGVVYDDYRKKYNQSRLALNWSSLDDLPSRVWEGFAMKRPVISNRITDLSKLFVENEDYLGFSSLPEAVEKVMWALDHPVECAEMAERVYKKVIAEHTWDIRVDTMLRSWDE